MRSTALNRHLLIQWGLRRIRSPELLFVVTSKRTVFKAMVVVSLMIMRTTTTTTTTMMMMMMMMIVSEAVLLQFVKQSQLQSRSWALTRLPPTDTFAAYPPLESRAGVQRGRPSMTASQEEGQDVRGFHASFPNTFISQICFSNKHAKWEMKKESEEERACRTELVFVTCSLKEKFFGILPLE